MNSTTMYNTRLYTRNITSRAVGTPCDIEIGASAAEFEFMNNAASFGDGYLRSLCDMPWAVSSGLVKNYRAELVAREEARAKVEPQSFDFGNIARNIVGTLDGYLEKLCITILQHPNIWKVFIWVLWVFLYAKYLRHMSFQKKALVFFVGMIADKLTTALLMKMAERYMIKELRKMYERKDFDNMFRTLDKMYGPEVASNVMDLFENLEEYNEYSKTVVRDLYTVEHPDDEDVPEEPTVEPQAGVEGILIALAIKLLFKKVPFYRLVVDHDKLHKGLGAMFSGAVGGVECVLNTVLKVFGKRPVTLLRAHEKVVNDWENAVRQFVDGVRTGATVAATAQAQMEYDRFRDQGLGLEANYKEPKTKAVIRRGMDALTSVACHFAVRSNCTARMEPMVVCLTGGAGVGKTTLARMIAANLAKHMCSPAEIESVGGDLTRLAFQKGTSEYWEGYCGQPITVMDDWLQGIPQPGVDNEVVNLIRAANQWPYPLNMAALELKGKVNFSSRAIMITTNTKNSFYISKVVASPAAVARRLDITYDVRVRPEFCLNGKLDVAKLAALEPRSVACYDSVWEFAPHNMETGATGQECIKLTDLIALMHRSYDMRVKSEDATRGMVQNFSELPLTVEPQIGAGALARGVIGACAVGVGVKVYGGVKAVTRAVAGATKAIGDARRTIRSVAASRTARTAAICGCLWLAKGLILEVVQILCTALRAVGSILKNGLKMLGLWRSNKRTIAQAGNLTPEAIAFQRNIVPIHMTKVATRHTFVCGYGVMLDGRHMLMPYHFLREMRSGVCTLQAGFKLEGLQDMSSFEAVVEAPAQSAGIRDMAIMKVGGIKRGYRDIRAHFRSIKDLHNPEPGWMLGQTEAVQTGVGGVLCSREYTNMKIGRVALLMHSARTVKGDCGSLIVAANPATARKIRGIHVAGDGTGYFCPVYLEDMPADDTEVEAEAFEGMDIVAEVPAIYNNGKTNIVPTCYSGYAVEPKGAPAHLRPARNDEGQVVDPMVAVVETSIVDFEAVELPDTMDTCVEAVVGEIFQDIGGADLSPLGYEEAIAGVLGDPFLKGVARGKSMGYPLVRKYANKRAAFGAEGPYVFDTPAAAEVRREYEALVAAYNNGEQGAVFRDCLKDEVLKFEKVKAVKTRLISASPVQFTILVKQLFGRFAAEFMRHRLKHGGLVGVNAYSPEWGIVRHELAKMNEEALGAAGDYKAFDKSQHPRVLGAILHAIARRLPHFVEKKKLFEGIVRDTCCALHLGGDSYRSWMIYRVSGTLPSGHPLTSILNSIYNMVVFRMAWVQKVGRGGVTAFRRNVRLYTYGDDNVFAPADEHKDFDLVYMSKFCDSIGMVYTSEDKGTELYTLKPVGRCGFLKRAFSLDIDGYTYAPLEWHSIWDMLNWRKKKTTDDEHLAEVSIAIVRELAAYDFGRFAEGICKLRQLLIARNVEDPTGGMGEEHAYELARCWYRGYTPVWSVEE